MDTLTQITLGAAVGETILGKKVGNKAVMWGAVGGLIPDLDMIPAAFMDDVTGLTIHRAFSHSILFSLLLSPILAFLIYKLHRKKTNTSFKAWISLLFFALITHILLDCFTTYGTQIFNPFSYYGVAFNSISVIDPLYTIPLLVCVIIVLFLNRTSKKRMIINYIGLGISTLYLSFTVLNKFYITSVFKQNLTQQHISYNRISTFPTIFNNILWRGVAECDDCYYVGYFSLLDSYNDIQFESVSKNHHLIQDFKDEAAIKKLKRFSKGYFAIESRHDLLIFNEMRYGKIPGTDSDYVFSFKIFPERINNKLIVVERNGRPKVSKAAFAQFIERILGNEVKG